jgi:hypothetical protein
MTTQKNANKAQYKEQLEKYEYMTKASALRLYNKIWKDLLTIRERIAIYKSVFQ